MFGQFNVGDMVYINLSIGEGKDPETECWFWNQMKDDGETPHRIIAKTGTGSGLRYMLDDISWVWIDKWLLPVDKIDVSLDRRQVESLL